MKVALSLQRLALVGKWRLFQSSNDSAEPIATEEEATQYAEQIAVKDEEASFDNC